MEYIPEVSLSNLFMEVSGLGDGKVKTEYEDIMNLMKEHQTFSITYMSDVRK